MAVIKSGLQLLPSALLCRDSPSPRSPDPLSHSVMPALAPASWPPWHDDLHPLRIYCLSYTHFPPCLLTLIYPRSFPPLQPSSALFALAFSASVHHALQNRLSSASGDT